MVDQAERLRAIIQGQNNFAVSSREKISRVIVVASGKGGVGKTNLVVNLAIAMSQLGKKVAILDSDLGMANVDILLDLKAKYSLVDVVQGRKELDEIILQGPFNIEVVPGGSCIPEVVSLDSGQRESFISRLSRLEEENNIILVDCPAGLSRNVLSYIAAADELVLVTTPEPTAITDVYGIIKIVNNYKLHSSVKLVVNMIHRNKDGETVYKRIARVCHNFLDIEPVFLGNIDYDQHVHKAVLNCYPYVMQFPRSRAAQCTRDIAHRLLHDGEPLSAEEQKSGGFLRRMLNLWKRSPE